MAFTLAMGELPAANFTANPGRWPAALEVWRLLHTGVESRLASVGLILLAGVAVAGSGAIARGERGVSARGPALADRLNRRSARAGPLRRQISIAPNFASGRNRRRMEERRASSLRRLSNAFSSGDQTTTVSPGERSNAATNAPSSWGLTDHSQITPDSAGHGDTRPTTPLIAGNGTVRKATATRVCGPVVRRRYASVVA